MSESWGGPFHKAGEAKAGATGKAVSAANDPADTATSPQQPTKAAQVEALMAREGGASLDELCSATGWLPHTCRAFLTGLRKKGRTILRGKREDGTTIYKLTAERAASADETGDAAEATS